jgi:hypothetical protein
MHTWLYTVLLGLIFVLILIINFTMIDFMWLILDSGTGWKFAPPIFYSKTFLSGTLLCAFALRKIAHTVSQYLIFLTYFRLACIYIMQNKIIYRITSFIHLTALLINCILSQRFVGLLLRLCAISPGEENTIFISCTDAWFRPLLLKRKIFIVLSKL